MLNSRSLIILTAVAASISVQVLAQQSAPSATPATTPSAAPNATPAVAAPNAPGLVATTNNPNLAVATVRLENGVRSSRIIGAAVYLDGTDKVGTVDDLIITGDSKVTVAVISIGGVLGVGAKLIAVQYAQLRLDGDKVMLSGVGKDALAAMPSFVY